MKIEIRHRITRSVIYECEAEDLRAAMIKAVKGGANLRGADIRDAYLGGADLRDADLRGADLRGAKNYVNSHDFWIEIIRRQTIDLFTEKEWAIIGQVYTYRLCWDSIKKRYGNDIMPIFKKLSDVGFDEWLEQYKGL